MFRYVVKSMVLILVMCFLTGCYFWDEPKWRNQSERIEDFAYWQKYIEEFASGHSYEFISKDFDGIDLEKKEWNGGTYIENEIAFDNDWRVTVVFSVNNSVEWFEIQLCNDNFEEYNEEYILQVVELYNALSNYEYTEEEILSFISSYVFNENVDERRDNHWSSSDFYMLKQNISEKKFEFSVGGWLRIPE